MEHQQQQHERQRARPQQRQKTLRALPTFLTILSIILFIKTTVSNAYTITNPLTFASSAKFHRCRHHSTFFSSTKLLSNNNDNDNDNNNNESSDDESSSSSSTNSKTPHPMKKNILSHAMLRVPNVNATVDYWISRGATVQSYNQRPSAETAFVNFQSFSFQSPPKKGINGDSSSINEEEEEKETIKRFSLEITSFPKEKEDEWDVGNVIQYFGLSMLLNFDLKSAAAGEKKSSSSSSTTAPPPPPIDYDPNGIQIKSVASGPGDPFSRVCLHVSPSVGLKAMTDFYVSVLGMESVAVGDDLVCLRYTGNMMEEDEDGKKRSVGGVSTTLVFTTLDNDDDSGEEEEEEEKVELNHGNCLDHFAIDTKSLEVAQTILKEAKMEDCVFMKPTPMFGTTLMGLEDPCGYKVYLVERKDME